MICTTGWAWQTGSSWLFWWPWTPWPCWTSWIVWTCWRDWTWGEDHITCITCKNKSAPNEAKLDCKYLTHKDTDLKWSQWTLNMFFLYVLYNHIKTRSHSHSVCPQGNPGSDGPPGRDGALGVKVRKQINSFNILLLSLKIKKQSSLTRQS